MTPNLRLRTSDAGIAVIKEFEKCHLKAYLCPSKKWTIGWGHTGPDVKPGMTITQERADELLENDLTRFENTVKAYITRPLTQQQFDALVSLAFNIGREAFRQSTLVKKINAGKLDEAPAWIKVWNKGGVPLKTLPGLVRRRQWEVNLWETGKVFGPK